MPEVVANDEEETDLYAVVQPMIPIDELVCRLRRFILRHDLYPSRLEELTSHLLELYQPKHSQFYWPVTCLLNEMHSFSKLSDLESADEPTKVRTEFNTSKIEFFRSEINRLLYDLSNASTMETDAHYEVNFLPFVFSPVHRRFHIVAVILFIILVVRPRARSS